MEIVLLGDLNKQMPVGGWKIDDSVHETAQHLHFAIRASEFIGRKQGIRTVGLAQLVRDHAYFTQTAKLTVFIIHLNSRARKQIFKSSKKVWSCKAMFDLWFHQVRVQELMMMVMESEKNCRDDIAKTEKDLFSSSTCFTSRRHPSSSRFVRNGKMCFMSKFLKLFCTPRAWN